MKLFLASEAKHPESMRKLENFVSGLKNKKIIYVPTAGNGEYYGAWKSSRSIQVVLSLGAKVEILELESCVYQNISERIHGADIVWFSGGMTGYLLYWFRRSELDKKINEILDSGTVYVGSSSGSMICSKSQQASEWYLREPEPGASLLPGLGLIDFEIYPHYQDELYDEISKRWNQGELYLLRDGDAITIENKKVSVLGEKNILVK